MKHHGVYPIKLKFLFLFFFGKVFFSPEQALETDPHSFDRGHGTGVNRKHQTAPASYPHPGGRGQVPDQHQNSNAQDTSRGSRNRRRRGRGLWIGRSPDAVNTHYTYLAFAGRRILSKKTLRANARSAKTFDK